MLNHLDVIGFLFRKAKKSDNQTKTEPQYANVYYWLIIMSMMLCMQSVYKLGLLNIVYVYSKCTSTRKLVH